MINQIGGLNVLVLDDDGVVVFRQRQRIDSARVLSARRELRRNQPAIEHGRITTEEVQDLKTDLATKAAKTVNNVLTVLSVLLKKAVEWNVIDRMPCSLTLLPAPKPSMSFYDFEEYDRLVVAAKALDPATHLLVLLGAEAGLRCGEMIALKWTDVNLGNQQLCIQRSAWKGQETTPKGGRLRYVKMTTRLATALREHRHLRSPYVLCQDDLRPLTRPVVQYRIKRAALAADLPPKGVHILRHTFCSHLAMLGASMSVTQALVGHAGLTMTRRYTHLSPAALEGAVALLDERAAKTEGNMVASGSTAVAKVNG